MDEKNRLMSNGGQLFVSSGDGNWVASGGESVYTVDGTDYLVYHAYDAHDDGAAKLRIEPIRWDSNGWPRVINTY